VPATQSAHALEPYATWAVPATQLVQLLALDGEKVPGEQLEHTVESIAPVAVEYAPAKHATQFVLPLLAWNLPDTHEVHTRAPTPENEPTEHTVQLAAPLIGW
jgi:hypothetical protein